MRVTARHLASLSGIVIATLAIPSCTEPRSPQQIAESNRELAPPTPLEPVDAVENGRIAADDSYDQIPDRIIRPGTGNVIGAIKTPSEETPPTDANDGISLNFVNADIGQVVKAVLGDILHKNFAIDPGVVGTVTFQTSAPLPKDSILPALEQVFHMSSVAIVRHGDMYIVQPAPQAAQTAEMIGPAQAGYGVEIVPLRYVSADDIQRLLTPISPPGAILKYDVARNLLVIGGSTQDRQAITENIKVFDVDWMAGMSFGLFTLQSADAATMAQELQTIAGGKDGPLDGIIRILPIQRLNAVLVISPQRKYVAQMEDWVQRLDKGQDTTEPHLYVYYVKNGRATDLASVLNRILTGSAGDQSQSSSSSTTTTTSSSMESGFGSPSAGGTGLGGAGPAGGGSFGGAPGSPGGAPGAAPDTLAGGASPQSSLLNAVNPESAEMASGTGSGAEAGLRITADESTNSLLILATERQYKTIASALGKLDIAPLQVMLEAAVAEVTLTNDLQYGLQYYFAHGGTNGNQNQVQLGNAGLNTTAVSALSAFSATTYPTFPGFGYTFGGGGNIQVILHALSDITKVNVVSSPKLLVLSNQTAQLLVGDQVPIATASSQSTLTSNAPVINSISYQSTGVILKVTPRVNEGGLVTMDVSQEVSSVGSSASATAASAASPTISDRRINTTVAVQDGETVALGGLIQNQTTHEHYGIPYVQNIPYVGALFRSTADNTDRTELLVLITPHIIQSVQRMRDVTSDLRREMAATAPIVQNP